MEEHYGCLYEPDPEKCHEFQLTFHWLELSHVATYNGKGVCTYGQAIIQRGEDGFREQS